MNSKQAYYLHCGIKMKYHNKDLKDFTNDPDALDSVRKYLGKLRAFKDKGVGLFLWGANGCGKTHLMSTAFLQILQDKHRYKVRIYTLDEIVSLFTNSWYSEEARAELHNTLRQVDFLGIDEFGKNLGKDGNPSPVPEIVKKVIESVIRERVQMGKPIWFTSNTDPKNVEKVFSEDIASLLNEAVVIVQVKGEDYRKKIYNENKKML